MTADPYRRKLRLSPEERQRRADQIRLHSAKGREAAAAARTPEHIQKFTRAGAAKRQENARRLKEMTSNDSIESIRDARKQTEAKAAKYRDSVARAASEAEKPMNADLVVAVMKDFRAEIAHLWAKERALAKAEGGDSGQGAPGASGGLSALSPALMPLDPATAAAD